MKPIETVYKDYRFRSRLEARWAVFFDTLGISWEYEKEGYDLDGVRYLPDFWLPDPKHECWVEIKGQVPTQLECEKAKKLALYTRHDVYVLWGEFEPFSCEPIQLRTIEESRRIFQRTGKYQPITELHYRGVRGHAFLYDDENRSVYLSDTFYRFGECKTCYNVGIWRDGESRNAYGTAFCICGEESDCSGTPRLMAAYAAARQARFEHGEAPRF